MNKKHIFAIETDGEFKFGIKHKFHDFEINPSIQLPLLKEKWTWLIGIEECDCQND